jgi:hypothetical protein
MENLSKIVSKKCVPRRLSSLLMSLLLGTVTTVLDPRRLRLTRGELATARTKGDALSSSAVGSIDAFFPLRSWRKEGNKIKCF